MNRILRLTLAIILAGCGSVMAQQNPHSEKMKRECDDCHMSTNWKRINFDHDSTNFTLVGKHAKTRCISCHSIADFSRVGGDCVSCHTDIHQGKLAITCDRCHTPQGWAVFNNINAHAGTSFPLVGPHAKLDCRTCHISDIQGEFSFMSSECYSCHQDDFEQATPSHAIGGFGTRCEDCHFPVSWQPANFARHSDYFPISTGSHAGTWESCRDCHTNPNDHSQFSCLGCHEHEQSRMNDEHNDVSNYSYDSNACYLCHPRGNEGD